MSERYLILLTVVIAYHKKPNKTISNSQMPFPSDRILREMQELSSLPLEDWDSDLVAKFGWLHKTHECILVTQTLRVQKTLLRAYCKIYRRLSPNAYSFERI